MCPNHITGSMYLSKIFYSVVELPPNTSYTFQDLVYQSDYKWYSLWIWAFGVTPQFFNYCPRFLCDLVTSVKTSIYPPLALCCYVTLKHHRVTTLMDYRFSYSSKKFIYECLHSSAHAHGTIVRSGKLDILKFT